MTLPQLALEEKVAAGQQPSLRDLLMAYPDFAPAFATIQAARAQAEAQQLENQQAGKINEIRNLLALREQLAAQIQNLGEAAPPDLTERLGAVDARLNALLSLAGAPSSVASDRIAQLLAGLDPAQREALQKRRTEMFALKPSKLPTRDEQLEWAHAFGIPEELVYNRYLPWRHKRGTLLDLIFPPGTGAIAEPPSGSNDVYYPPGML